MRVFVYEHTCCSDRADFAGSGSLRREGLAMLSTVLDDFAHVAGVEAIGLVSESCAGCLPAHLPCRVCRGDEAQAFRTLAGSADYTLAIAPECAGILETRCRWVLEAGGRLLGPSPEAARLAGDKRLLAWHLHRAGIPTPRTLRGRNGGLASSYPQVAKPRHGAGSLATFLVRSSEELPGILARAREESPDDEIVRQEFVPGRPVSVAFLVGPKLLIPLLPADQHFTDDGRFHYRGGSLPLPPPLAARATCLASRAVAALPGRNGYIGVDLVLGDAPDGRLDRVIEINPRLTTSYVGLRAAAQFNVAEAMLKVAMGEAPGAMSWKQETVTFRPDGQFVFGCASK